MENTSSPEPEQTTSGIASLAPEQLLQSEIAQVNQIYQIVLEFLTNYSFQLIGALIILGLGFLVSSKLSNIVLNLCCKNKLDITLSRFLANTSKVLLLVLFTIIALGKIGVSVTPFVAAIGAVSLGAGIALQGLLANYAAGFNIIFIRPFVVGDTITVQGKTGIVKEVLLAYTILVDEDEVEITIPNKHIVGETIENSKKDSLLKLTIGVAYHHNPKDVVPIIKEAIQALDIASDSREPQVGIDEFANSSVNILVRLWTPIEQLYAAKFTAQQAIYDALKQHNISIPFPQREVRFLNKP